ncbi:hypothetical protein ACO0M4_10665 [Streptomyces sp. RGM 3693]
MARQLQSVVGSPSESADPDIPEPAQLVRELVLKRPEFAWPWEGFAVWGA